MSISISTVSRQLSLSARASGMVEFPLEFTETGTAKWVWRARFVEPQAESYSDSVQSLLQVGWPAPMLKEIHLGRCAAPQTNLIARANPQLLEGKGTISVRVANTRLIELGEAVAHLLRYPYGCLEQTCSSLLPWLALRDFSAVFPELQKGPAEFDAAVRYGLDRLWSMQTDSGGLSYWPGGQAPMLWASAYGGMTLMIAKRHGYSLPLANVGRLTNYLRGELKHSAQLLDNIDLSDRCLTLYVLALAGHAEPSYHELVFQNRDRLSAESRALLALAILESNGPMEMVQELLAPKKSLPPQGDLWFGCPARELAARLLAWCRYQPANDQVDILVEELFKTRQDAHWTTTQGNAWAIYALAEYATRIERAAKTVAGSVTWGPVSRDFRLHDKASTFETSFVTAREMVNVPLTLSNPQQQLLFTQVKLEARPRATQQPRQDRGFALQRRYALVADDGTIRELRQPRVGDLVLITLRLEVRQPAHYVAIDDPLPAVFEAVNPKFKSQTTRAGVAQMDWVSNFHELRTDRALFFCDHIAPGNYTISYLARVRAAGTATAPGAKVEEMYHPDRFGLAESVEVTSLPIEQ
jgi:uncharacterized protein YfaS (alpha-2-macroglobulin family)